MENTGIEIFKSEEFGKVRTTTYNDQVWFVGKDVAIALGYSNASKAITDHVEKGDKLYNGKLLSLGQRGGWLINESGLYSLVLSSRLESATRFKRWITSEVIPSIRKSGGYIQGQESMSNEELLSRALLFAQNKIDERDKKIAELTPKADYYDSLCEAGECTGIRETAKILNVPEQWFVRFLIENRYCFKDARGKIFPMSDKQRIGLFECKEYKYDNSSTTRTLVTPKGRMELFYKVLIEKADSAESHKNNTIFVVR